MMELLALLKNKLKLHDHCHQLSTALKRGDQAGRAMQEQARRQQSISERAFSRILGANTCESPRTAKCSGSTDAGCLSLFGVRQSKPRSRPEKGSTRKNGRAVSATAGQRDFAKLRKRMGTRTSLSSEEGDADA